MSHEHNRRAWDAMARRGDRFARAVSDRDFTPSLSELDPNGWLGESVRGKRMLCLAAGGGRQGPLYAAAGAEVTVVDISPAQLDIDIQVARERSLQVRTVETSMDNLSAFSIGEFDIVIHPVATCYLPEIAPIYREVARVTASDGIYISQHKQPTSLQAGVESNAGGYRIEEPYYRTGPLPSVEGSLHREAGTLEYLHRWEEIIGELCRSGFVIEDLVEPCHAKRDAAVDSFGHRSQFVAPYVRIKARRRASGTSGILLADL